MVAIGQLFRGNSRVCPKITQLQCPKFVHRKCVTWIKNNIVSLYWLCACQFIYHYPGYMDGTAK